jgi:hypothetical protein
MTEREKILSTFRIVLRGLKNRSSSPTVESLNFVKKTLRDKTPVEFSLYQKYAEYLKNLRTHEDLLRRYKLTSNANEDENVIKTAAMVGLRTPKPSFQQDPNSHFDKLREEMKNAFN